MSAKIEQKQALVEGIKEKFQAAKSAVIINYTGISVEDDTKMRKEMRENNIEYKVLKNTLIKRAFADLGIEGFDEDLNGPTAIAFSNSDEVSGPRIVNKFVESTKKISVKSGVMGTTKLDASKVKALSNIPASEVLLAQLLYAMKSPISKFAVALNAIAEQKN